MATKNTLNSSDDMDSMNLVFMNNARSATEETGLKDLVYVMMCGVGNCSAFLNNVDEFH